MVITLDIWSVLGIFVISYIFGVVVERYIQHPINSESDICNCNKKNEIINNEDIIIKKDDNVIHTTNFKQSSNSRMKLNEGLCRRCGKADWALHKGFCSDCFEWAYID